MKKDIFRYIYVVLALVIVVLCVILLTQNSGCGGESPAEPTVVYPSTEEQTEAKTEVTEPVSEPTTEEPTTEEAYVSPINWEDLWEKNPEIYAWIYIPGTEISYPVTQREGDDTYYLEHDAYLNEYDGGSIMSESKYNDKSFDEPVTILYGHKMRSGAMLGTLQYVYEEAESFKEHPEVIIYLPDKELHYEVWMATSFDRYHIMQSFDFTRLKGMRVFLKTLRETRAIDSQINESLEVTTDDKLLILSTCLRGKVSKRYLLISRLGTVE